MPKDRPWQRTARPGFVPILCGRVWPAWCVVFALPMMVVLLMVDLAAATGLPWPRAG